MYSQSYISFIIDVLPSSYYQQNGRLYWETSFEELECFLILLQDVEAINNPGVGITKPAYANFVSQLGYTATSSYVVSGNAFQCSTAVMGKHGGSPLPWGFINITTTPIILDITNFRISAFPNAITGKIAYHNDDKLLQYRLHPNFINSGNYWDYMPLHSCIIDIINSMKAVSYSRTDSFVKNILKWV